MHVYDCRLPTLSAGMIKRQPALINFCIQNTVLQISRMWLCIITALSSRICQNRVAQPSSSMHVSHTVRVQPKAVACFSLYRFLMHDHPFRIVRYWVSLFNSTIPIVGIKDGNLLDLASDSCGSGTKSPPSNQLLGFTSWACHWSIFTLLLQRILIGSPLFAAHSSTREEAKYTDSSESSRTLTRRRSCWIGSLRCYSHARIHSTRNIHLSNIRTNAGPYWHSYHYVL